MSIWMDRRMRTYEHGYKHEHGKGMAWVLERTRGYDGGSRQTGDADRRGEHTHVVKWEKRWDSLKGQSSSGDNGELYMCRVN